MKNTKMIVLLAAAAIVIYLMFKGQAAAGVAGLSATATPVGTLASPGAAGVTYIGLPIPGSAAPVSPAAAAASAAVAATKAGASVGTIASGAPVGGTGGAYDLLDDPLGLADTSELDTGGALNLLDPSLDANAQGLDTGGAFNLLDDSAASSLDATTASFASADSIGDSIDV